MLSRHEAGGRGDGLGERLINAGGRQMAVRSKLTNATVDVVASAAAAASRPSTAGALCHCRAIAHGEAAVRRTAIDERRRMILLRLVMVDRARTLTVLHRPIDVTQLRETPS